MGESKNFLQILNSSKYKYLVEDYDIRDIDLGDAYKRFGKFIVNAINNKLRVYIKPDVDCDGVFSAIQIKMLFDKLYYENYVVEPITERTHGIDDYFARTVIQSYDAVIIVDSSTNCIEQLNKMAEYGKKVMVIDHHMPSVDLSDYHENVTMINSKFINEDFCFSAGALISLLCYDFFKGFKVERRDFIELGAITIYSDSCFIDKWNLAIIRLSQIFSEYVIPQCIRPFMNEYCVYGRDFFNYTLNNRINACLRGEEFSIINNFIQGIYEMDKIEECYKKSKEYTEQLIQTCNVVSMKNIVFVFLSEGGKASNYTGLVANYYSTLTNKACYVVSQDLKCSLRDAQQRDLLHITMLYFRGGGHKCAFGFKLRYDQLQEFQKFCEMLDNFLKDNISEDIIVEDFRYLNEMADFNEVSNVNALIKHRITKEDTIKKYKSIFNIQIGSNKVVAFKPVRYGDIIYIKPSLGKNTNKLNVVSMEVGGL